MQPIENKATDKAAGTTQQSVASGKQNPQNGIPAHEAAEADMLADTELNGTAGPDDGLDEGELARLEGED